MVIERDVNSQKLNISRTKMTATPIRLLLASNTEMTQNKVSCQIVPLLFILFINYLLRMTMGNNILAK